METQLKQDIRKIIGENCLADDEVQMTALTDVVLDELCRIPQSQLTTNHIRAIIKEEFAIWESMRNGENQSVSWRQH